MSQRSSLCGVSGSRSASAAAVFRRKIVLLTAPIIDFYDPTRSPELLKLERETYTAYRRMIAAASKDLGGSIKFTKTGELAEGEKFLRIVSAFRSPEYQQQLRQQSPGSGRVALAKNSAHSTGQALDLYVGGEPVSTKDANRLNQVRTPAYKWLVKNAARFGFHNYFYEPWHWEYVGGMRGRWCFDFSFLLAEGPPPATRARILEQALNVNLTVKNYGPVTV